ncbi:MAG: hypothetical protein IJH83_05215 [Coriobacteriales bacterium]|nr:hypothetical protein [Coriobacteriales bacterium]
MDSAATPQVPIFPAMRWRMAGTTLPLYERHLRCLKNYGVSSPLQAWIRSRLEWTMDNLAFEHPDHVIGIRILDDDNVDVTLEPQRPAPGRDCIRHILGWGIEPRDETCEGYSLGGEALVWVVQEDGSVAPCGEPRSACNTLVRDLITTLRFPLAPARELPDFQTEAVRDCFVVDDEFGLLPANALDDDPITVKLIDCFRKLWTVAP